MTVLKGSKKKNPRIQHKIKTIDKPRTIIEDKLLSSTIANLTRIQSMPISTKEISPLTKDQSFLVLLIMTTSRRASPKFYQRDNKQPVPAREQEGGRE